MCMEIDELWKRSKGAGGGRAGGMCWSFCVVQFCGRKLVSKAKNIPSFHFTKPLSSFSVCNIKVITLASNTEWKVSKDVTALTVVCVHKFCVKSLILEDPSVLGGSTIQSHIQFIVKGQISQHFVKKYFHSKNWKSLSIYSGKWLQTFCVKIIRKGGKQCIQKEHVQLTSLQKRGQRYEMSFDNAYVFCWTVPLFFRRNELRIKSLEGISSF